MSGLSDLNIDEYVPALLTWLYNKMGSQTSRIYRNRHGIGVSDWRVLGYIGIFGPATASGACEVLGLDKAAVSRSVARLSSLQLVEQLPSKGREVALRLTKDGKTLADEMTATAIDIEHELLNGISPKERAEYVDVTRRMLKNVSRLQQF